MILGAFAELSLPQSAICELWNVLSPKGGLLVTAF
jgi:hypothetical protein